MSEPATRPASAEQSAQAAEARLRQMERAARVRTARIGTLYRFGWGAVLVVLGTLVSNASFWQGAGVIVGSLITAVGFAVAAIGVIAWGVRLGLESVDLDESA